MFTIHLQAVLLKRAVVVLRRVGEYFHRAARVVFRLCFGGRFEILFGEFVEEMGAAVAFFFHVDVADAQVVEKSMQQPAQLFFIIDVSVAVGEL